jgi:putative hemolysin
MNNQPPKLTYASPNDPKLKSILIQSIERLTGQRKLQNLYQELLDQVDSGASFWGAALSQLRITLAYDRRQLEKIPQTGPLLLIGNHPFGLLDGLAMGYIASKVRPHFKILIHSALCQESRIAPYLLPIDFEETVAAIQTNINSKRAALATLHQNNAVVIFPGGGISTAVGPFGQVTDLEWKLFAAKLIQMTQATVVPIYFHGQNSRLFQIVSQFSLTLRLSLIIHEVHRKMGDTLLMTIGDPIPYPHLADIRKRKDLTNYLRNITYGLSQRP